MLKCFAKFATYVFSSSTLLDVTLYCGTCYPWCYYLHMKKNILLFLYWVSCSYFNRLEGITLNVAGNNRLIPVERVTGGDFWIVSKVLEKNPYINGMSP